MMLGRNIYDLIKVMDEVRDACKEMKAIVI